MIIFNRFPIVDSNSKKRNGLAHDLCHLDRMEQLVFPDSTSCSRLPVTVFFIIICSPACASCLRTFPAPAAEGYGFKKL